MMIMMVIIKIATIIITIKLTRVIKIRIIIIIINKIKIIAIIIPTKVLTASSKLLSTSQLRQQQKKITRV